MVVVVMEVKEKDNQEENLKEAFKKALANLMLEDDFCLEISEFEKENDNHEKILTLGGKKNGR